MKPIISLIIPVYGTEKYLERCIDSVLNQNYKELEIIVVNDCSPGNAEEMIHKFQSRDARIKYIKHEENRGLFQARMSGAAAATGDYIAFLDSDDYVSFDFYYGLITKAEAEKADIVIGKTVIENEDGSRYINHFHDCSLNVEKLEGEEVKRRFFGQRSRCYSWHTVWNKLYAKKLWDQAFPYYKKINTHVIMTEDIAFSSVLFYFAQKVVTVKTSAYFYCVNEGASTNSRNMTIKRFKKNMTDIITVFNFVRDFLEEQGADERIREDFNDSRKFYTKLWLGLTHGDFVGKYKKEALKYIDELCPGFRDTMQPEDYFYDSMRVKWNDTFEIVKKLVSDPEIEYISFDIFDTLITRPLYKPQHVFELMDYEFKELVPTNASFVNIRVDGEAAARKKFGVEYPEYQDITLDEIYDVIGEMYHLDFSVIQLLKNKEIELEIGLSACRRSTKELFDLAKSLGKKIIIVSDMYLTKDTIEKVLKKNGYEGYNKLYLSSDIRLTKYTGDLFKYVLNDLEVPGKKILHLGDTWVNDYENPQKLGFHTFFIPKTIEAFENRINGQVTNRCATMANWAAAGIIKQNSYKDSAGYGAFMALVANKYFDNPYRTFCEKTDLNADPYFIGYYPVGMHLYGMAKWLLERGKELGYKKLYFMSRDGYLPMLVYQKLAGAEKDAPEAEYIYSSRKAVMPYIMNNRFDLYGFPTAILNQSAETMKYLLEFCMKKLDMETYRTILSKHGIVPGARFSDREAYNRFIGVFLQEFYSEEEHKRSKELCAKYYSRLEENSATVDMGYSGRIQGAICQAAGHGVDVFFIHADSNQYIKESQNHNFKIHSFYDYEPCMSGVIREHIFSSFEPSCTGFEEEDGRVVPVFEKVKKDIQDCWLVGEIHRGALDFVDDVVEKLGGYIGRMPLKATEISLPYEGFLRFAQETDLKIFSASFFEDEVWGGANRINIAQFIQDQHVYYNRNNGIPETGAVITDGGGENQVITSIKKKLSRYPRLEWMARKVYKKFCGRFW